LPAEGRCLDHQPKVLVGGNGISGPAFADNAEYREYLFATFKAQVLDMETAATAQVAYANRVPFIAFRSLSDLAGGDAGANQSWVFGRLPRAMPPALSPALWPPFRPEKTTMIEKRYLSANELLADSFRLGNIILDSDFRPTHIVGIWRGGAPVGIAVQELLEYHGVMTDHIAIRTASYTGIDKQDDHVRVYSLGYLIDTLEPTDRLLVIDDVFDSGRSIAAFLKELARAAATTRRKRSAPPPSITSRAARWT
jgi:hypoxanthine phosphoribosyltransferase